MSIIKKQFSTFTVSYEDVEITPNNYCHYGVFVDNEDYGVCIRGGEFNYDSHFKFVLMMNNKFEK